MILVGTNTATGTTVTIPAHQPGDLLVICAGRAASATAPTMPITWIAPATGNKAGTSVSGRIGYKWASSTSDVSGTWTNATQLDVHVYRPTSGNTAAVGNIAWSSSSNNTVNYPALTMMDGSGASWVAGFAFVSNGTETVNVAPSGMTNETSLVNGSTSWIAGHDTESGVASWSSTNATTTGTAGNSVSATIEIMDLPASSAPAQIIKHIAGMSTNNAFETITDSVFNLPCLDPVGAGNTLVLKVMFPNGVTVTITDNNGNSWPSLGSAGTVHANAGSGNLDTAVFVLFGANAGATTITATLGSAQSEFGYDIKEITNIDTSAGIVASSATAYTVGPVLATGTLTMPNNDATGGNLVLAYYDIAPQPPTHLTSNYKATLPMVLMDADLAEKQANAGFRASTAYLQTSHANINPKITVLLGTDQWNSIGLALKINTSQGTGSTGIQLRKMFHWTTPAFPSTGGAWAVQMPVTGNFRMIGFTDASTAGSTVTDSEGNTWLEVGTGYNQYYCQNTKANSNLTVIVVPPSGANTNISIHGWDITGADTSGFDSAVESLMSFGAVTSFTQSPSPSPSNTNGLVIANIEMDIGPAIGVTAPSGAVFDNINYPTKTDQDPFDNADIAAHYYNSASGTETWTFSISAHAGNGTSGAIVCIKAPTAAPSVVPKLKSLRPSTMILRK